MILKSDLIEEFKRIGIKKGDNLLIHSSLSKFKGFIVGGAQAFTDALLEVIGEEGTLVVPIQFSTNSEPSLFENPPVDFADIKKVRENIPFFDKNNNESFYMGVVVENIRRRKNVVISNHPTFAFAAIGKYSSVLCNNHSFDFGFGDNSPLKRIYDLNFKNILFGVNYDNATIFHLAEKRSGTCPIYVDGSNIKLNGDKIFFNRLEVESDTDLFLEIGLTLEKLNLVKKEVIAECEIKIFNSKPAVDIFQKYLEDRFKIYML